AYARFLSWLEAETASSPVDEITAAQALEGFRARLAELGVDLAAVSADSEAQLRDHTERLTVGFPLYYGLTTVQMQQLGLYVSEPRSPKETDHPFAEPGLFVINEAGRLHVVDVSNNPFVRPALEALVSGIDWIRRPENNYPIRGMRTFAA
ncbi:MAG: redoxin domain-containing protein, partial [Myxococcota bacterium]